MIKPLGYKNNFSDFFAEIEHEFRENKTENAYQSVFTFEGV